MRKSKKHIDQKELSFGDLEKYKDSQMGDMTFDIEGSHEDGTHPEIAIYKQMLAESNEKVIKYEKFLQEKGLMDDADASYVSDEETICLQGIEMIKQLVVQRVFTKDDINSFDVLHRNLCIIRGIKMDKKKGSKNTPSSRDELLKLVKQK